MYFGKIYISAKGMQTNADITDYKDGVAYFDLFGEKCKCNVLQRTVFHEVKGKWLPHDRLQDVADVRTPDV